MSAPTPSRSGRLEERGTSPVDVCFRFSQQSAIVNGTLYLYGGQAASQQGQTENTWNNNFYNLDLTRNWSISQPALTGLPVPVGSPAIALGYLWNSHQALYLYGGEFSWKPPVTPTAFSLWEYSIPQQAWNEHQAPKTSAGTNAPNNDALVQRAAEGAGVNVPSLGRGFYFGGHLDAYTTPGWSQSVPRLYLQSLLEYTFPGYSNDQVTALSGGRDAGTDGSYRNITTGGIQSQGGFTTRADGVLVYVPGYGQQGILIALAGGTNETFTQMNVLDVYDIATSTWYRQSTSGSYPSLRVNPCAVVAAAPDGSSYNIYMFGGQNLLPYGNQTQLSDMWILSVPSFAWISVDQSTQSVPYGRSGHTCNIWDAQMIMVGGYTGVDLTCESTGIYVFDLSTLQWTQQYIARSNNNTNPFSQQADQIEGSGSTSGLEGSYDYHVPDTVASIIGGGSTGGATITTPLAAPTSGPFATGSAVSYTVTQTATATGTAGQPPTVANDRLAGPSIGAIVAGIIAGLLLILVGYLLFCSYIYRKQVQLYRQHAEMYRGRLQTEKDLEDVNLLISSPYGYRGANDGFAHWPVQEHNSRHDSPFETRASGSGSQSRVHRPVSSSSDLLKGMEPTFVGVMLNPRRSLRVINRD